MHLTALTKETYFSISFANKYQLFLEAEGHVVCNFWWENRSEKSTFPYFCWLTTMKLSKIPFVENSRTKSHCNSANGAWNDETGWKSDDEIVTTKAIKVNFHAQWIYDVDLFIVQWRCFRLQFMFSKKAQKITKSSLSIWHLLSKPQIDGEYFAIFFCGLLRKYELNIKALCTSAFTERHIF